jgi:hypothetical protein
MVVAIKKSPQKPGTQNEQAKKANVVLCLKPSGLPSDRNHSSHQGVPEPRPKFFVVRYIRSGAKRKKAGENKANPVLNIR